ncbi:MAG: PHP domain-containing protein [Porticoccaceae bacterium]
MLFDLHCHTNASDGMLSAPELVQRAIEHDVDVLSITDHDCTTAYAQLKDSDLGNLKLVAGIELSAQWRNAGIHVLGLNIRVDAPAMIEAVTLQQNARRKRAGIIAERLEKKGFTNVISEVEKLSDDISIGRPHIANILVTAGHVKTVDAAFRKYLGTGKIGDVKNEWATLEQIIEWIRGAGGTAVIAHPSKYKMTRTRLQNLVGDFKDLGGQGLEVVSGRQDNSDSKKLAELCAQFELLSSCGSDFHKPGQPWAELGKHKALPESCVPVWEHW